MKRWSYFVPQFENDDIWNQNLKKYFKNTLWLSGLCVKLPKFNSLLLQNMRLLYEFYSETFLLTWHCGVLSIEMSLVHFRFWLHHQSLDLCMKRLKSNCEHPKVQTTKRSTYSKTRQLLWNPSCRLEGLIHLPFWFGYSLKQILTFLKTVFIISPKYQKELT